jgi:hypothetical protein
MFFLPLVLGGCFAPRSVFSLAGEARPAQTTALLPVTKGQVIMKADLHGFSGETMAVTGVILKEYDDVVSTCNSVFNSLAAGARNPLQGPAKLRDVVGNDLDLYAQRFSVYIDDPGPRDESWKSAGFAELERKLGVSQVVRVRIVVAGKVVEVEGDSSVVAGGWDGLVNLTAELWSLTPPYPVAQGTGKAEFWGRIGIIGSQGSGAPFALGTTFGRAVDHAMRQALTQLFQTTRPEGTKK